MSSKSSMEYLGKVTGNNSSAINPHTIKSNEVMLPKLVSQGSVMSLKINLD